MAVVKGKDDFDKMPTIGGTDPIVPSGGTVGQVLTKDTATDYDYSWQDSLSAVAWGDITGTLSNQTDLQNALDAKAVSGGAEHDGFSDFVANEHVDHSTITLTAGAGLSGGGDITASRSFSVNVQNSIEIDTDTLQLVGDVASPGNDYFYGTNATGVKGWYQHSAFFKQNIFADQVDFPRGTDWSVTNGAPASADSNNSGFVVRLFDDTTPEAVGFQTGAPAGATEMVIITSCRAETAPGATQVAKLQLHFRSIPDNGPVSAWTTVNLTDVSLPTNENFQYDVTSDTLTNWGITANTAYQFQVSRNAGDAGDTLVGDLAMLGITVEFH